MEDRVLFQKIESLRQKGFGSCLATIVNTKGSTPRDVGAKMVITLNHESYGSIGGGCGEKQVHSAALRCLLVSKKPELVDVDLTDDLGTKGGDVCGGKIQVFIEPFFPAE
ncbi:MAG: XdhC family protein [Deltaproteobacteria bacterium]|nr:XdhC family protein [Deltaproteobacteria bacterium]